MYEELSLLRLPLRVTCSDKSRMKSEQVEAQSEFVALPWHHQELGMVFPGTPPGTCSGFDP
jgi:hypothetical protein